jgi:hypothetical protein
MRGIIVGDNFYDQPRVAIIRTNGAHRVAGLMRNQGLEVEVLDFFNSWEEEELEKITSAYSPDFIGLSFGLGQLDNDKVNSFISLAKEANPNTKVIAGGNQVLYNSIKNIDLHFKGFAAAYTEIPVDELLQLKRPEWDWEYVKKAAEDFVEDYKRKKYQFSTIKHRYSFSVP